MDIPVDTPPTTPPPHHPTTACQPIGIDEHLHAGHAASQQIRNSCDALRPLGAGVRKLEIGVRERNGCMSQVRWTSHVWIGHAMRAYVGRVPGGRVLLDHRRPLHDAGNLKRVHWDHVGVCETERAKRVSAVQVTTGKPQNKTKTKPSATRGRSSGGATPRNRP